MSYEKQTWNKYDDLKTEEENIENGAVVTDNRMNHIEEGIYSHTNDTSNPHKVTAAQVGLGNVQNFGLATEDETKQAISNAKYMTPSLTQAVLSANINSIAYANSADGTDGFTTSYPNLNLLDGTKDFSGNWENSSGWVTDGTYKGLAVKKRTAPWNGIYKTFTALKDGKYTSSTYVKSSGDADINGVVFINGVQKAINRLGDDFDWKRDKITVDLKAGDVAFSRYEISTSNANCILWTAGHKWEPGSTATPYIPSASEVTTTDWPKFVGFSNTVKTNKSASDYTWFPVKDSELTNKVESHINNKANPHAVTASQVGAYSKQEIDTKLSKAVMADDSGKVTVSNTIDSGQVKTATIQTGYGRSAVITRIGNTVTITSQNQHSSVPANGSWQRGIGTLPVGFRPVTDALVYNHDLTNASKFSWNILHPNGAIDLYSNGSIATTDYILTSGQFWITKDELPS
ncbi:hypothetical protein [Lactococcus lactis]|uniref:hypothetical protein n=1 Tax=Lactococcus lactis TaxID=1358 RepID=UPI0021A28CBA|nr:hypothetical protein [Lactococcus lactis]